MWAAAKQVRDSVHCWDGWDVGSVELWEDWVAGLHQGLQGGQPADLQQGWLVGL